MIAASGKLNKLYKKIVGLESYTPSDQVNALFSELVAKVISPFDSELLTNAQIPHIRKAASLAETELESFWSKKIIASQCAKTLLNSFPYLKNYQTLVALEWAVVQSLTNINSKSAVLFIGGGPLPLTSIVLAQEYGVFSTVLDNDPKALVLGRKVVEKLDLSSHIQITGGSAQEFDYRDFDLIYIAALAGNGSAEKKAIFDQIKLTAPNNTHLIARSAHGKRSWLYEPLNPCVTAGFETLVEVIPQNEIINSIIILTS